MKFKISKSEIISEVSHISVRSEIILFILDSFNNNVSHISVVKKHEQLCQMLPKTLIRPLSVQDHKSERFRRPALLLVGEQRRLDGVDYNDGTKARRGKNLAWFNVSLVVPDRSYI